MQAWTMAIVKNIPIGSNEARYIQLRFEGFNVFNHPNFQDVNIGWNISPPSGTSPATLSAGANGVRAASNPNCDPSVPYGSCFGEYKTTYSGNGGPRVFQLAAKFVF